MNELQLGLCCTLSGICNTRRFALNTCFIGFGFMIDDFRLMIEKSFTKSAIIDHRSRMLSASIQTRQEMLTKLARKAWDMPEKQEGVER